jgi:dihydroflavonol-4-reductase
MKNPVFVTGGTGFVGVNLVRALISRGCSVRVLVRPESPRAGLDLDGITFVEGDVTDIDSLRNAMGGCGSVFHVAGWVNITPWGAETARRVNVVGTENICRVCNEVGVERLIHTSSVAAVAHAPLNRLANEESSWNLDVVKTPYYSTKYEAEQVVHRYVREADLDAVIVNPGYVVGPFDIKPTGGRLILRIALGKVPGFPSHGGIGFVDVREVVQGMLLAHEKGRRGQRYILVGDNLSYGDYARLVADVAGVKPPSFAAPYWMLFPAAVVTTAVGWLRNGVFDDFNLAVVRTGFCEHYLSSQKARDELGVVHHPIRTAIEDALDWFVSNGYILRHADGWQAVG